MNWDSLDAATLAHARTLGRFRARHPALARGAHTRLSEQPYVFARRIDASAASDAAGADRVIVAPEASGAIDVAVAGVFADGTRLRDAYSGRETLVRKGRVALRAEGSVLLEAAP